MIVELMMTMMMMMKPMELGVKLIPREMKPRTMITIVVTADNEEFFIFFDVIPVSSCPLHSTDGASHCGFLFSLSSHTTRVGKKGRQRR